MFIYLVDIKEKGLENIWKHVNKAIYYYMYNYFDIIFLLIHLRKQANALNGLIWNPRKKLITRKYVQIQSLLKLISKTNSHFPINYTFYAYLLVN